MRRVPKYGNDVDEVDSLAQRVADDFIDLMDTMRSPLNGRYFVHLFTFKLNIEFGKMTGATPDGRRALEPLAYSLSAHQGRDETGVTTMLKSLSKLPHNRAGGASAAIIDLDPSLVEGEAGTRRLATLIRSAIDIGVGQLQWNVTNVERLMLAKQNPEQYACRSWKGIQRRYERIAFHTYYSCPECFLRMGKNELVITLHDGSWVSYDAICLLDMGQLKHMSDLPRKPVLHGFNSFTVNSFQQL